MNGMEIGILQGRLSPSVDGRFQFFPADWSAEFAVAKEMGFAGLEWLAYWSELEQGTNPLLSHEGRRAIGRQVSTSGVPVTSVHAQYFTKYHPNTDGAWRKVFLSLIDAASHTTRRLLLMPILEDNAPSSTEQDEAIRISLRSFVPALEKLKVTLAFETEMDRGRLARFVDGFQSQWVGVLYDIGNCTSYGFDCPTDIRMLGHRVKGVHVKDRKVGSSQSVTLGTGDANIGGCIQALAEIGWNGTLIMQAWRGQDYLRDAREQLAYLKNIIKEANAHART